MSQIHQLIYMSRPSKGLSDDDVAQILRSARRHNSANFITGYLAFNGEFFLQVLEGDASALTSTLARILADARHRDCLLIGFAPVKARSFSEWGMGYAALATQHRPLLMRYCSAGQLLPGSLSAEGALCLLADLCSADPVQARQAQAA